jgi:hypothetical protein
MSKPRMFLIVLTLTSIIPIITVFSQDIVSSANVGQSIGMVDQDKEAAKTANVTMMTNQKTEDQKYNQTAENLAEVSSFSQVITLVPPNDSYPESNNAIAAYANDTDWRTFIVTNDSNLSSLQSVQLEIPNPLEGNVLPNNSILPILPQSSIYRFKYLDIQSHDGVNVPFKYVEVDWNTEGLPRGPNGSFVNPHYDFHFYTKTPEFINQELTCFTSEKTCDHMQTGYVQARRFLTLPPQNFVPNSYFPDSESSIANMGLHNLDGRFNYTIQNVNDNPVIIYGTFDGEIVFLEASLTLYAFQNAISSDAPISWQISQPQVYSYEWWPNSMTLEFDPTRDVFIFSLTDFESHSIETA